jgi:hypothetical protein
VTVRGDEARRLAQRYAEEARRYAQAHDEWVSQFPPYPIGDEVVPRDDGTWAESSALREHMDAVERSRSRPPTTDAKDYAYRRFAEAIGDEGTDTSLDREAREHAGGLADAIDLAIQEGDPVDDLIESAGSIAEWVERERAAVDTETGRPE